MLILTTVTLVIADSLVSQKFLSAILLCMTFAAFVVLSQAHAGNTEQPETVNAYAKWENGPPSDPGYFPIAVWLQNPRNAAKYKAAGINLYVDRKSVV